jgi:hypothetical protein
MGYRYFNKQLIDDLVVDPLKPEGLVYTSGPEGQLMLVTVEYVVPGANSNPPGASVPPTVLGREMHILVPAVGFHIQGTYHPTTIRSAASGLLDSTGSMRVFAVVTASRVLEYTILSADE